MKTTTIGILMLSLTLFCAGLTLTLDAMLSPRDSNEGVIKPDDQAVKNMQESIIVQKRMIYFLYVGSGVLGVLILTAGLLEKRKTPNKKIIYE